MIEITDIRHAWPEKDGFTISRTKGHKNYTFLHFFNSVELFLRGARVITKPNSIIIFDKNTPQYFKSQGPLKHNWFHFDGDISGVLRYDIELDKLYCVEDADFITKKVREMEYEFFSPTVYSGEYTNLLLENLMINLARKIAAKPSFSVDKSLAKDLGDLRNEMFLSLELPWTVERMAKRVGLSKSRFYVVYKKLYANTPIEDLIKARIDSAKNQLESGEDTILEISRSLGYNNVTHFIRQFKNFTGFSPESYRRKVK